MYFISNFKAPSHVFSLPDTENRLCWVRMFVEEPLNINILHSNISLTLLNHLDVIYPSSSFNRINWTKYKFIKIHMKTWNSFDVLKQFPRFFTLRIFCKKKYFVDYWTTERSIKRYLWNQKLAKTHLLYFVIIYLYETSVPWTYYSFL